VSQQHEFYGAAVGEPCRLLGLDLKPFSLGHVILLHFLDNAFVTGAPPTMEDLASAVFVCAQSYQDNLAVLHTGKVTLVNRWGVVRLTTVGKAMQHWQRSIGAFDLGEKCREFRVYMERGSKHPIVSTVHGVRPGSQLNDCPFAQVVKVALLSEMNFTEAEVMDRSWSLCLWDYFTLKMIAGELRIVDNDQIQAAGNLADELQRRIDAGELKL
jgi:hypothetical protein